jgi:hypothetical protein
MNKLLLILALALDSGIAAESAAEKWVPLFNGNDLSGWKVQCQPQDRSKSFWSADQGTILCDSMGRKDHNYVWLLSEGEYGDFELKLKFQVYRSSPGNSGLQFRSRFDPSANGGWLDGPQVDIHPPESMPWRTGLIYDETREERRWIFPSLKDSTMEARFKPDQFLLKYAEDGGAWNEFTLVCRGMQIKTILNGLVRADWNAAGVLDNPAHVKHRVGRQGHFALQLHSGDELRIRFKDILIREL